MSDVNLLTIAASLVATMFALLVAIFGWLGNKIYERLGELGKTLHNVEQELHGRITDLDRRVTRVEAKCDTNHKA